MVHVGRIEIKNIPMSNTSAIVALAINAVILVKMKGGLILFLIYGLVHGHALCACL